MTNSCESEKFRHSNTHMHQSHGYVWHKQSVLQRDRYQPYNRVSHVNVLACRIMLKVFGVLAKEQLPESDTISSGR